MERAVELVQELTTSYQQRTLPSQLPETSTAEGESSVGEPVQILPEICPLVEEEPPRNIFLYHQLDYFF